LAKQVHTRACGEEGRGGEAPFFMGSEVRFSRMKHKVSSSILDKNLPAAQVIGREAVGNWLQTRAICKNMRNDLEANKLCNKSVHKNNIQCPDSLPLTTTGPNPA
jgi:hypothetical protein